MVTVYSTLASLVYVGMKIPSLYLVLINTHLPSYSRLALLTLVTASDARAALLLLLAASFKKL